MIDTVLYKPIDLPCGSKAYYDIDSGIAFRCSTCNAVVGSIGMPRDCKELLDMEESVNILKGNTHGNV